MDPWSAAADEVALEGLDGITVPSLWIRLEDRQPKFPLKLDDCTKELIWRFLISNTDLRFYQLPQERRDVELFDRFKDIDPETGIGTAQTFSEKNKEVYPVHIILENKDGIQGSCPVFRERSDITKHVRSESLTPLVSLEEALERYGRKLVAVASNGVRFRTLIGSENDPDVKLNDDSYCLLEKVGRARWQGELQSELHRCSFKTDARKLHYMRKSLIKNGLITMQSHVTRAKSGQQQQHSILLLLKRFHINRRTKYDILMEQVSNLLQQLPGQFSTMMAIKQQLDVADRTFKRVFQYMRAAKLVELCQFPLEELDPSAKHCTTKKGTKVLVRCLRLLKPYSQKGVPDDDDDDDEDEEDDSGTRRRAFPPCGRIMEKDVLSQAYHIVLSCGTKGMPKTGIGYRMHVGKLESRMICRRLERDGVLKGFMEDEGRQRITKYIGHKCVSDQLQLFAKEQERKELLFSSAPQTSEPAAAASKVPPPPRSTGKGNTKRKKNQKAGGGDEDAEEAGQTCGDVEVGGEALDGGGGKARGKSRAGRKSRGKKGSETEKQTQPDVPLMQPTPAECETPTCSESKTSTTPDVLMTEQAATEEEDQSNVTCVPPVAQTEASSNKPEDNNIVVVKDVCPQEAPSRQKSKIKKRSHETYRLLKRKNQIVEAVRSFKIIEGLYPLQKMIHDEEKLEGVSSKCCKKTILRLVQTLSREGSLKFYTTTVIQDGITKKVQMVAHPSIQPNDDVVQRVIDQVRFKISSCYSAMRQQDGKAREQESQSDSAGSPSKGQKDRAKEKKEEKNFKPTTVRGLGKSLGFQPKMHRLRVVHNFLWYLIYGHPLKHNSADSQPTGETSANVHISDADAKHPDNRDKQDLKDTQNSTIVDETTQSSDTADSAVSKLDLTSGDEEEEQKSESKPGDSQSDMKVYADEDTWKRFIPPARVHKEFSSGWAVVGDLLLCLPLSVFIQVIQINYNVDGLEEYLNDPVKQHLLVRDLPAKMRRQLLYRRKYLFSFHENLQKLVYMGLLQLGPIEKFMEKDQVFLYLKRNATIVDTTSAEPHYWLIAESPDKPFEKRKYTFNTFEDVENYWFDLMCVCLNTPLGVVRSKKSVTEDDSAPSFVRERTVFVGIAYLLKGSHEVYDDGSIPGDGKGAAGLDSEFFAHLKRNWLWTNHLLSVKANPAVFEARENKIRLKSLLSKNALRFAFKAGGSTKLRYLTTKLPLVAENVELGIEPVTRNQQVVGGKRQKRKRSKKEVVKVPRKKKKEPKKRTPAHDEADHRALKMMTRQRVYWSVQEDSLMMLCSVASHLLNSKLKRPFVPYCGVRDLLHSEFEISMDKTSVAVGRRTRYILKNPQTLLNYRICLAEIYQDKALMKQLEEKKPADPNRLEDCTAAFLEYTRLLRQKFSSFMSPCDINTPDTKQELFSRFKVSAIDSAKQVLGKDTLKCTDDIHTIVLHNLIQSTLAMTNGQMKSSRSFQTFHMYSKYNQELLCQVFIQCRKSGLVNRRRVNQPFGPKKNRALPILPMSYQLSQSYYRCFSWRLPYSLCTDSFRFMRSLINNGTGDDRPVTLFYHEPVNRLENGEQVLEQQKLSKRKEKQSEVNAESTTVSEPEEQPKEANTESTKEGENEQKQEEGEEKLMEVDKTEEEKNPVDNLTAGSGEDPSSREQTDDQLPEEKPSEEVTASDAAPGVSADPPDVSDMLPFSLDSPGGACVVSLSLISLGLLNVYLSIPRQMVVVDSTLVDNEVVKSMAALEEEDDNDDDDGEECEGRKKLEVKAHQASHTKYLMMRGFCCPGIVKVRNLNTNDNIVVESCIMRLQLRDKPAHHIFGLEDSPPLDILKCGPSLVPSILTSTVSFCPSPSSSSSSSSLSHSVEECDRSLIEQGGYTPQDMEACADLRRSLEEAGEKGLDVHDLYQAHTHQVKPQSGRTRSLQQYLQDLHEEGQLLKVGAQGVRYVLLKHAEPWLLTVNSKQWSQSRVTPDRLKFFNNPLMRKRFRRESKQETEEPPAKKAALDKQESKDGADGADGADGGDGGGSDATRETPNEEAQMEKRMRSDEGSGEKQLNLEEAEPGEQTQHEEEGGEKTGQEKMETEVQHEEKRELRSSKCSIDDENVEEASGLSDVDENVSFISRPWRLVDGKLNRLVCKGMLESLLYQIMSRPGVTQQALVEHYTNVLQPMAVLDLVQALLDIGAVVKKTLVKSPKPSLFSRPGNQTRRQTDEELEEPGSVFYEPTISCCLRLSRLLPNERHWNYCIP
ncbi:general transcription factor 3C polypeptide 1 [Hippoglossus stenolepis]|uniref:general transcription factor 3C polypeptide 1 n=1 Tax=Hippoglossus stenolepis TaxID=195615 RepID=UPI001FAF41A0|nr:general transcription factor 3C polypeptide 1 [Hippoglossus stenolepis]